MLNRLCSHGNRLVEVRPMDAWVCGALARGSVGTKLHAVAPRELTRLGRWLPPKNRTLKEWGMTWAFSWGEHHGQPGGKPMDF